ncbi:hypothetical protein O6H91_04G029500 [Diphasiastrum complanatum]|nr:hypothetical protein O6H91_04G029500 [Diphasiastrum complanatum]
MLLGLSAAQFPASTDSSGMNDFKEEDMWAEEIRGWADDDDSFRRVDRRFSAKDSGDPLRLHSGSRRWLGRNPDPLGDTGLARGLSGLSQLRDGTNARIAATSRRISMVQSMDAGRQIIPQSLPVNVPDWSKILGSEKQNHNAWVNESFTEEDMDDEDKLPPHELLARQYARSEMTTFSVFEGAGRTLKGRDLSRVRYAVLRQTGFIDS